MKKTQSKESCFDMTVPASANNLAKRFSGKGGDRLLLEAFAKQPVFESNKGVIDRIIGAAKIIPYERDEVIIQQDAIDSDILFILIGTVIINVNGRDDTKRQAGTHVGELTTIDPSVRRSATVRAEGEVVIASVAEADFSQIASEYPFLWRHIAKELGHRLRERVMKVKTRNARPRIFVGSSSEGLSLASKLTDCFAADPYDIVKWTDGIFTPGHTFIDSLETEISRADFALLFLSPDDRVVSRWRLSRAPRDNLIFELGIFMGAIGHERALMVCPRRMHVKLPSDLDGITSIRYSTDDMEPVALGLRPIFQRMGAK